MTGNTSSPDDRGLQFISCSSRDLPMILENSLALLGEFQKGIDLDLSILRRALIARASQEVPQYTKLVLESDTIGWYHLVERQDSVELDDVNIMEAYRSRGYGSAIIRRVVDHVRPSGRPLFVTVTSENTRAQRFYEKNGFHFSHIDEQHHRVYSYNWK